MKPVNVMNAEEIDNVKNAKNTRKLKDQFWNCSIDMATIGISYFWNSYKNSDL